MKKIVMGSIIVGPLIDRLLGRIGLLKPRPRPIGPHDELWLFNNTAFRSTKDQNQWLAEFVACYFQRNSGDAAAATIADILEKLGIVDGDEAEKRVAERVELFLNIIQPGRTVELQVNNGKGGDIHLGPAGTNGISSDILPFPTPSGSRYQDTQLIPSAARLPNNYGHNHQLNGFETMTTFFAEPEGWGVISDIDDTIKITHVNNRLDLLRHTFALPSTPVAGTPHLFRNYLNPTLNNPCWFYLSASPYNLYPTLSTFLNENSFPQGTLILRDMSWQEVEAFIYTALTVGTQEYKVDRIRKIHDWFPRRKMILIGDSTQKDPESYGEVARKWPGWVKAIYIRIVKGVDEGLEKDLNSQARFDKAFAGLPKGLWHTCDDLMEIEDHLTNVVITENDKS